jgi:hypothetical protein
MKLIINNAKTTQHRVKFCSYCNSVQYELCFLTFNNKSRVSSVGIALGYGLDDRGSRVRLQVGAGIFFFSPPRPDRVRGPPSLLSNTHRGLFLQELSGRGVKLTENATPPLPQYVFMAWCLIKQEMRLHGAVLS